MTDVLVDIAMIIGAASATYIIPAIHRIKAEKDAAILSHEQIMKYGREDASIPGITERNCIQCNFKFSSNQCEFTLCGNCRRELIRSGKVHLWKPLEH